MQILTMSLSDRFDLFTDCYVYGCIAYFIALFAYRLFLSLLACIDNVRHSKPTQPDFCEQVKDLFNLSEELNNNALAYRSPASKKVAVSV